MVDVVNPSLAKIRGSSSRQLASNRKAANIQAKGVMLQGLTSLINAGLSVGNAVSGAIKEAEQQQSAAELFGEFETAAEAQAARVSLESGDISDITLASQIKGDIDTLSEIAVAREQGMITTDEANARSLNLLSEAKKRNPKSSKTLEKAFSGFFGGSMGLQRTAEEKIAAERAQAVRAGQIKNIQEASELGMNPNDLANLKRKSKVLDTQKKSLDAKIAQGSFQSDDIESSMTIQYDQVYKDTFADVIRLSNQKELTNEDVKNIRNIYNSKIIASDRDLLNMKDQARQNKVYYDPVTDDRLAGVRDRNAQALEKLLTDNSYRDMVTQNADVMGKNIEVYAMQHAPELAAMKEAVGPEGMRNMFEYINAAATGNTAYMTAMKNNPVFGPLINDLFDEGGKPISAKIADSVMQGTALLAGTKEGGEQPMTPNESFGITTKLTSRAGMNEVLSFAKEDQERVISNLRKATQQVPESLGAYLGRNWSIKKNTDENVVPLVQNSIEAQAKRVQAQFLLDGKEFKGISFKEGTTQLRQGQQVKMTSDKYFATGQGIADLTSQWIDLSVRVANEYPEIWKDNFESGVDYVNSLYGVQPASPEVEDGTE